MDKNTAFELLKEDHVLDTKPRTTRNIILSLVVQGDIDLSEAGVTTDIFQVIEEINSRIVRTEIRGFDGRDQLFILASESLLHIDTLLEYDQRYFGHELDSEHTERFSEIVDTFLSNIDYISTWKELVLAIRDNEISTFRFTQFLAIYRRSLKMHYYNLIPERKELNQQELIVEMVGHLISGRLDPSEVYRILNSLTKYE